MIKSNNTKIRDYGFTYKYLKKVDVTEEHYEPILKMLNKSGTIIRMVYETDSKGKLHIHGIWQNNGRTPLFKKMCPQGYHSFFEELYDEDGWNRYIDKDYYKNNPL